MRQLSAAAKNLALMGVNGIALFDPAVVCWADLASNYALAEAAVHAGQTRADACLPAIADLNSAVHVRCFSGKLTRADLSAFQVSDLPPPAEPDFS
jgi:molybdopterin/thiamine biosynthesis adenylyltransferase